MKLLLVLMLVALTPVLMSAQSGRIKGTPTPTPRAGQISGPSVLTASTPMPRGVKPTPSPASIPRVEGDEVIKIESVLVPIPASVTDVNGRAITSLKAEDFQLKVAGRAVEIAELARSETPIRLAMLFDNSGSVFAAREFEKDAAIRFLRRIIRPDRDLAALFSVADYTRLEQPFTRDVSLLTRSIELFPEPKGATALLDGIIEVSDYLRSASGRRVLVVVSDGEDTYSQIDTTLEQVIRRLQINDCQVYVVRTKDFENFKRTGMRGGNANIRSLAAERRMLEIAQQTGGAVYSPIDEAEMKEAFDRISAELSQQYVLSYYPDDDVPALRGEFRSIEVTVKSGRNYVVRTRKGYYVPK
jgi:Ca-activated chloride channel homolog